MNDFDLQIENPSPGFKAKTLPGGNQWSIGELIFATTMVALSLAVYQYLGGWLLGIIGSLLLIGAANRAFAPTNILFAALRSAVLAAVLIVPLYGLGVLENPFAGLITVLFLPPIGYVMGWVECELKTID
jgi:hypothetical protein